MTALQIVAVVLILVLYGCAFIGFLAFMDELFFEARRKQRRRMRA